MQAAAEARKPCVAERWPLQLRGGGGVCNLTGCLDSVLDVKLGESGALSPARTPLLRCTLIAGREWHLAPWAWGQRLPSCHTCGKRKAMGPSFQRKSRGLGHKWGLMEELK